MSSSSSSTAASPLPGAIVFPGRRSWPSLQSLHFDQAGDVGNRSSLKRCLVASSLGQDGRRVELSDVLFHDDAKRWSQAPLSLELLYNDRVATQATTGASAAAAAASPRSPVVRDRAVCCPDGCTLVQRVGSGFCHLLLTDSARRVKWQRRWDADLGLLDADFRSGTVYLPQYAKGVVHALRYPDMQPSQEQTLSHQRLVTAERVVAKSRFVAVDGFVLDAAGATVPGLAVFDVDRRELLCAAPLPDGLRKGWTFTVTEDGHLMLAESQADRDTNRFRLFGYTRSGDLDFTVKLLAALQQPWRLQLVKDNLGRDYIREEDSETRVLVPVDAYLRKERLDAQRLASARELAKSTGFPQSIC